MVGWKTEYSQKRKIPRWCRVFSVALMPTVGIRFEGGHRGNVICRGRLWIQPESLGCLCKIQDNVLQLNIHRKQTMRLLDWESLVECFWKEISIIHSQCETKEDKDGKVSVRFSYKAIIGILWQVTVQWSDVARSQTTVGWGVNGRWGSRKTNLSNYEEV